MMKTKQAMTMATFFCSAFLLFTAGAEVIVANYDFAGQSLSSADTDPNSIASDFTVASTYPLGAATTSTLGGTAFVRADDVDGTEAAPGDEAGAIAQGYYLSFTIEPIAGQQLDLTTLGFDILFDISPTFDPTPFGVWFVKSSVGGFGTGDPTLGSRNAPVSTTDTDIATIDPLIDLSGLPTITSSTTFRLYIYDNESSSSYPHRLDNVILRADITVIPEPASVILLGIALLAVRRRRVDG